MDNNPQLDERIWQAWIQKNAAQDQVRFRRRVKVIGLIALCLAFSALLFEIHKVSADVFELRPIPGFRSKTALGRSPIARMLVVAVAMNPQNAECDDAVAELEKQGLTVRLHNRENNTWHIADGGLYSGYIASGDELVELRRTNNLNIPAIKSLG
jgi:hypothetical protein